MSFVVSFVTAKILEEEEELFCFHMRGLRWKYDAKKRPLTKNHVLTPKPEMGLNPPGSKLQVELPV